MAELTLTFDLYRNGVLADADGDVLLSDESGSYGVRRADTQQIIVADGTPMVRAAAGQYRYTLDDAIAGIEYEWWAEFTVGAQTYHVRSVAKAAGLVVATGGISTGLLIHRLDVLRVNQQRDEIGGAVETLTTEAADVPALVQFRGGEPTISGGREKRGYDVSILFGFDVGLGPNHRLKWIDGRGQTWTMRVLAWRDMGGMGRAWLAECEVIQA